jgi:hypothetical protein
LRAVPDLTPEPPLAVAGGGVAGVLENNSSQKRLKYVRRERKRLRWWTSDVRLLSMNLRALTNDRLVTLISLRAEAIRRTDDATELAALEGQLVAYRGELSRRLQAELAAAEIAEREAEQDKLLDNYCAI